MRADCVYFVHPTPSTNKMFGIQWMLDKYLLNESFLKVQAGNLIIEFRVALFSLCLSPASLHIPL